MVGWLVNNATSNRTPTLLLIAIPWVDAKNPSSSPNRASCCGSNGARYTTTASSSSVCAPSSSCLSGVFRLVAYTEAVVVVALEFDVVSSVSINEMTSRLAAADRSVRRVDVAGAGCLLGNGGTVK
jgi:hypothetical protein